MARNKLTAEDADRRIRAQMANAQRVLRADRVIWNNGTAQELERAVRFAFWRLCCGFFACLGWTFWVVVGGVGWSRPDICGGGGGRPDLLKNT